METVCEKCQDRLTDEPYMFVCTQDCTSFCRKCAAVLHCVCPNCEEHLERHSQTQDED